MRPHVWCDKLGLYSQRSAAAEVSHAWESWTINTLVMALFGGADQDAGDHEMWLAEL